MAIGIVGTKCGMSRVFMKSGRSVAVTVIRAEPNLVTAVKQYKNRHSVQVSWGKAGKRIRRSELGQYAGDNLNPGRGLREFRLETGAQAERGAELRVDQFSPGDRVDVTGSSRGKGFAGTVKRWNFRMQDATHGNSLSHRAPGSIGQCQFPGKVWKGKKMAGHMGNARVTIQNLEVLEVDVGSHLLLVAGAVPGAPGSRVELRPSLKPRGKSLLAKDAPAADLVARVEAAPEEESADQPDSSDQAQENPDQKAEQ